jgi:hypothetical protein
VKVTIDVQRVGGKPGKLGDLDVTWPLPLVRFDAYENKDRRRLDAEIQHTISILLEDPTVQGIQITVEK